MAANSQAAEDLFAKIRALPDERRAEVEDFVDFLRQRRNDHHLVTAAAKLSEEAFRKVWDNEEDAAYDRL